MKMFRNKYNYKKIQIENKLYFQEKCRISHLKIKEKKEIYP